MNNGVMLDSTQLSEIANEIKISATTMAEILQEVTNEFSKIGDEGTWSGTAASATKEEFDLLSAKFPEFSEAVESCYTYLVGTVIPNYQAAEAKITGNL